MGNTAKQLGKSSGSCVSTRGRDCGDECLCGSYSYVGEDTAEVQRVEHTWIFEGEECIDDLRSVYQFEVQVWEPTFLGEEVLCEHSRAE